MARTPCRFAFREPPARLRRAGQLNHNCGSTIDFINLSTLPVQHIEYANPPCQNRTPKSNPASKKPLSPFPNAIDLISRQLRVNFVCLNRLRARSTGCFSKQERPAENKKLSEDQELAVCQYLDRLDTIGTAACMIMITNCANSILRRSHTDTTTPPPTVSEKWARLFLNRHPEYYVRKQKTIDTTRKTSHEIGRAHV